MRKILIISEGPNDIGRREWSSRLDDFEVTEGWLQPLVRRIRSSSGEEIGARLRELISLPGRAARPLSGLALKAQIAKLRAASENCVAVIVATDADSVDPRDYALKVGAIEAGFAGIDADVIGVACVPIGTSEAWLLSDQVSWTKLGATELGNLPRRPERAWGRPHEPSSNHPKCIFVRMCRANDIPDTSETRRSLANLCDMEVLNRLVPISFRPFAQEVKKI